jgi:O-antigen/teichoic acid export membrane protein
VLQQAGQQAGRFIVQLLLARILLPEEFGLVAMVSVFLTIANMVAQGGLGTALVQVGEITEADRRTAFTLNVLLGLAGAGALYLFAPILADFYGKAELIPILRVMSVTVFLQQFGGIHSALFGRDLRYKETMKANVPSVFIAGFCGIGFAMNGFGVWALVWQSIIGALVASLLLWYFSDWSPRFGFSMESVKRLLPFGWRVAANQLLNAIFSNAYVLVIGKFYSASDVAFYQRAKGFQSLPMVSLFQVFNRVAFPLLSRLQSDVERMQAVFRKLLLVLSWCVFPGMALLAAIAEPMIVVLIKEKWLPAVPYLRILCAMGVFMTINMVNMNFLQASGRAGLVLKLSIVGHALVVFNILITAHISVMAMVLGQLCVGFLSMVIRLVLLRKYCGVSVRSQLSVICMPIVTACVLFAVVLSLGALPLASEGHLLLGLFIGALVWWLGLFVCRSRFQDDVRQLSEQYPALRLAIRYSFILVPVKK